MLNLEKILVDLSLLFFEPDTISGFFHNPKNTAVVVASCIALGTGFLGCFTLLRGNSLSSDAISHSVLFGIVVVFLGLDSLGQRITVNSPLLILGATLAGLATVILTEFLQKTGLIKKDAALGLVFTFLFASAIVLISRYADDIHLDEDSVMIGEIGILWANTKTYQLSDYPDITIRPDDPSAEFSRRCINCENISPRDPSARFETICSNCGTYSPSQAYAQGLSSIKPEQVFWPESLTPIAYISLLGLLLILLFFKELKLATFDPLLAQSLGFRPQILHYLLMAWVSLLAVAAFNAVGSVLVVAFFIIPPATAYLFANRLWIMLLLSASIGIASVFIGYDLAQGHILGFDLSKILRFNWDSSISASMVIAMLLIFGISLLFAPQYGIISTLLRQQKQKHQFKKMIILGHILHHRGTSEEARELHINTLSHHIQWNPTELEAILIQLQAENLISVNTEDIILLSEKGKEQLKSFWETGKLTISSKK